MSAGHFIEGAHDIGSGCFAYPQPGGGWGYMKQLLTASLLALVACVASAQPGTKPNVVLVITDDVGYGDIGSYGAPDIKTPNLDRLAEQGTRFTDFYAAPTCTPTRAALMTGRYQQRSALERPLGSAAKPGGDAGLPALGDSLPQLLKNNGYATALIGKWHLGYKPEYQPNAHGFDYFFGFLSGYIDYYHHTGGDGDHDLFENGKPIHVEGYITDHITQRSIDFIQKNRKQPFFLEVAYNAAHWPFQAPDRPSKAADNARLVGPSDENTGTREDYAAMLERVDQGVGEILAALKASGLEQNTLVIFTNDNGGEWLSRNAPLFHRKDTVWEGGVRVPTIMRWPGKLPEGRICGQLGITMDLTATILAATNSGGGKRDSDGINLLPILQGKAPEVERTLFFRVLTGQRQQRAVRQGGWKLVIDGGAVPGAPMGPPMLLFNLREDIGERNDVARYHTDIVRRLYTQLAAWEADVGAEAKMHKRKN